MNDTKSPLTSKTIIASVVTLICMAVGVITNGNTQIGADDQDQIVSLIVEIMGAVSSAVAIWGRITATKTISMKSPTPPAVPPAANTAAVTPAPSSGSGTAAAILLACAMAVSLSACGSLGSSAPTAQVSVANLTPRDVLYSMEAAYTAALDTVVQINAQTPLSADAKNSVASASKTVSAALNAADVVVLTAPTNTTGIQNAIQQAQTALSALQSVVQGLQANKGA